MCSVLTDTASCSPQAGKEWVGEEENDRENAMARGRAGGGVVLGESA
jgi:hypothetical protein